MKNLVPLKPLQLQVETLGTNNTMTHTLETLLPLLDKDGNPINQEAFDKLRVWAAELDGWKWNAECDLGGKAFPECWTHDEFNMVFHDYELPNYPTSLDAIYAAEKRAGLHDVNNIELRRQWEQFAALILFSEYGTGFKSVMLAFLTPAQRAVIFILTLQQKQTL